MIIGLRYVSISRKHYLTIRNFLFDIHLSGKPALEAYSRSGHRSQYHMHMQTCTVLTGESGARGWQLMFELSRAAQTSIFVD